MLSNKYSFKKYSEVFTKCAHNFRPSRLEALCLFIRQCRLKKKYNLAFKYGIRAINNTYPKYDLLFIDKDVHEWKFFDELALCCHSLKQNILSKFIYDRLIKEKNT